MPSTSIALGFLLIVIGAAGYTYGFMDGKASITALIPAFVGIVLVVLGAAARAKEGLRKHLMHAAVAIALLGFIASAGRLFSKFSELTLTPAVISQIAMAVVCLLFVVLGIKSFADARRNRAV